MPEDRRLAAIMFTDIVGYTALMGESESSAFKTLNTNLQIHQKLTDKYHGKIVKELGDGLLAVFENGTEAVLCAVEIQKEAHKESISLRIGIHEGEVVFRNGDIFGDEVNLASRIQEECAAGGVCISDNVYRIIRNKEGIKTESIGKKLLKNVKEPVALYQLKSPGLATRSLYKTTRINPWVVFIALIAGILAGVFLAQKFIQPEVDQSVKRLKILLPEEAPRSYIGTNSVSISPDGKTIVYTGKSGISTMLFKRSMDAYAVEAIPGTEGAENPFFSPDGRWIGFFSDNILHKVLIGGGKVNDLCSLSEYGSALWLPNDSIVIGGIPGEGLKIVSASGGTPSTLTTVDFEKGEWKHNEPSYIQGTDKVLFVTESGSLAKLSINLYNYKTRQAKVLMLNASAPKYIPNGYLLHESEGSVYANSFDIEKDIIGKSTILLIKGQTSTIGISMIQYQLSDDGILVYYTEQNRFGKEELVLVDMNGTATPISTRSKTHVGPKFSPDGENIAFWNAESSNPQVWIYNFDREAITRFTSEGQNFWPIWTPDGKSIYFPSIRSGSSNVGIYGKSFKGTETSKKLFKSVKAVQPKAFTKDGNLLLYHQVEINEQQMGIHIFDMVSGESKPFLESNFDERKPDFSPDDKWVVYESNETGNLEVFVTNFPEKSRKVQISTSGGYEPLWSHKGDRIFYRYNDDFYVVQVNMKQGISFSKPRILFSGKYRYQSGWGRYYDLSPDETHFVTVKEIFDESAISSLNVITNFFAEVKQKAAEQ